MNTNLLERARQALASLVLEQLSLDEGSGIKKARMLQRDLGAASAKGKGANIRTRRGQIYLNPEAAASLQKQLADIDVSSRKGMADYQKLLGSFANKAARGSRKNTPDRDTFKVGDDRVRTTREEPSKLSRPRDKSVAISNRSRRRGFRGKAPEEGKVQVYGRGRGTPFFPKPEDPKPKPKPPGIKIPPRVKGIAKGAGKFLDKFRMAYTPVGGFGKGGDIMSNTMGRPDRLGDPTSKFKPGEPSLQAKGYLSQSRLARKRQAFNRLSPEDRANRTKAFNARQRRVARQAAVNPTPAISSAGTQSRPAGMGAKPTVQTPPVNFKPALNAPVNKKAVNQQAANRKGMQKIMGNSTELVRGARQALAERCWVGWRQKGMKKKGNRIVPNCVKEENEVEKGAKRIKRAAKKAKEHGGDPAKAADKVVNRLYQAGDQSLQTK
tara:strand:- start:15 stop:1328 length:1314 start_codon:yes stop_codon:yes gene_type:complete